MLELDGVTRRFGAVTAVDSVTLAIPNGQMLGVIGRSGAGTSTLLRMINRLVEPSEGRILFEGVNVTALRGRRLCDWRGRCAMVFQQFNLVQRLDVLTNVLVGRLNHRGTLSSLPSSPRPRSRRRRSARMTGSLSPTPPRSAPTRFRAGA